jgi:molybdopterin molybdotransferase
VPPDTDIVYAGEDVAKGKLIAKRGDVIGPALAGAMAGQGIARVKVYRRPKIFVMSTGSELLEPGEELQPAKIYNSNVFTISAYLENMGAQCVSGGSVRDDAQVIAEKINAALAECDMVVTTGGASVGDYDYAVRASQMTGANVLFWKIAMKPGGSVVAAEKDGKLILSLSGNPGAATLTLLRVAAPYIKALCGMSDTAYEPIEMVLGEDFNKKSPQRRIIRGHLDLHGGKAALVPMKGQGNGMVSSMIGCDLLGDIPAGSPPLKAGDKILAYRV